MNPRMLPLVSGLAVLLFLPHGALADAPVVDGAPLSFTSQAIPLPEDGGLIAVELNDNGLLCGSAEGEAAVYDPATGTRTQFGVAAGYEHAIALVINNAGDILRESHRLSGSERAYHIIAPDGAETELPNMIDNDPSLWVRWKYMNDRREATGMAIVETTGAPSYQLFFRAVRWSPTGGLEILEPLNPGDERGYGDYINKYGRVIGTSQDSIYSVQTPLSYAPGSATAESMGLPPDTSDIWIMQDINDRGATLVSAIDSIYSGVAVVAAVHRQGMWETLPPVVRGSMGGNAFHTRARSINNTGLILAEATRPQDEKQPLPYLYWEGDWHLLFDLISSGPTPEFAQAQEINNKNAVLILKWTSNSLENQTQNFLLTPICQAQAVGNALPFGYELVDVSALTGLGSGLALTCINDSGLMAGTKAVSGGSRPVTFQIDAANNYTLTQLPVPAGTTFTEVRDISQNGTIVGAVYLPTGPDGQTEITACYWKNGSITLIGFLSPSPVIIAGNEFPQVSRAFAISPDGSRIVGVSRMNASDGTYLYDQPFEFDVATNSISHIPTPEGFPLALRLAGDVNDDGDIALQATLPPSADRYLVLRSEGTFSQPLQSLPEANPDIWGPSSINRFGDIASTVFRDSEPDIVYAAHLTTSTGTTILPRLPDGSGGFERRSEQNGILDSQVVYGSSGAFETDKYATIWHHGCIYKVEDLAEPGSDALRQFSEVLGMNEGGHGVLTSWATGSVSAARYAYYMRPMFEPGSLAEWFADDNGSPFYTTDDLLRDDDNDHLPDYWERWKLAGTEEYIGTDDPERDGLTLLEEMVMDLSPMAFDPQPGLDFLSMDGANWLAVTYRESTVPKTSELQVTESTDLSGFEAHEIDGVMRELEVIDADPDGDGTSVLKQYRRKLLEDEHSLFLRLEFSPITRGW